MTTEKWQRVKEVFDAALRQEPEARQNYINEACGDDKDLLTEVESLVSSFDKVDDFLEMPAVAQVADMLESDTVTLETGTRFGHYEVIRQIGSGGMGEVYLAKDTRLERSVALKLLPTHFTQDRGHLRRFEQEARAVAALSHPNVCTIHEVIQTGEGRHCIVMEYVGGVTLRTRMRGRRVSLAATVDIALQIAGALGAAHDAGIVHRDIKPENLMVRPDGLVKVLDFGIAKYAGPARGRDTKESWVKTATGVVVGTTAYMSPEQARGQAVDARTDVWSLGVILYEMIARRLPFPGKTPSDRVAAILEREPEPLGHLRRGVPAELQRIVGRALAKNRDERYTRVVDLAEDLRKLRATLGAEPPFRFTLPAPARGLLFSRKRRAVALASLLLVSIAALVGALSYVFDRESSRPASLTEIKSLAVLPVKPINLANRDEIYEIGIADALINRLGSTKRLVVRPLSATRRYADVGQDPLAAGREQQVDYVLVSNYQLAAGKIRITAQLLDVTSGQIEETYKSENDAGDVFAMEDAIAAEIGNLLHARFATTSSTQAAKRGTSNEQAYLLYLQGMYLLDKEETTADAKRAIELFDKAVSLDLDYAKAWAGKARAHCAFAHWGGSSSDAEFARAKPAIGQALALDNNLPEAYGVLGIIKADYDWNFAESERQFLRAIEIAPESDNVNRWYASRLAGQGRSEEAIARIKTAIDLNPTSVFHQIIYGRILYFARRYDDAITQLQRVIEMDSARPIAYSILWRSYHKKGDYPRAYESFMRLQRLRGTEDEVLKNYEASYAKSGWQGVLLRNMEILKAINAKGSYAYNISVLSALLGQREQSLRYLNDAVKNRSLNISDINGDPGFDLLRDDPRFAEVVRRVEIELKPAA